MAIHNRSTRKVAVLGGVRIPFARSGTAYSALTTKELLVASLRALVDAFGLRGRTLDEVVLGAVINRSSLWNIARDAVLASGLASETPALGIQRACGTGLDAAITVANKIALGQIEVGIAGGADSMSDMPVLFRRELGQRILRSSRARTLKERLSPWAGVKFGELKPEYVFIAEATTGKSMGEYCEMMAKNWGIGRREQDELAFESHRKTAAAYGRGFYKDLVASFAGLQRDNNVRSDVTIEKLSKLRPVFDRSEAGTLTAGNSSALTDGSACVLLSSETWARADGYPITAYLTEYENAAVNFETEGLLMAPVYAVPRLLMRAGLSLRDFDFFEIHEAFAAQVLCTLKAWESEDFCRDKLGLKGALGSIDRSKLNVAGGSIAIGHPFAATGGRMLAALAKLLEEKGSGRGLLSICAGGGMGTTAILERF